VQGTLDTIQLQSSVSRLIANEERNASLNFAKPTGEGQIYFLGLTVTRGYGT
jgi:hypothetical protein